MGGGEEGRWPPPAQEEDLHAAALRGTLLAAAARLAEFEEALSGLAALLPWPVSGMREEERRQPDARSLMLGAVEHTLEAYLRPAIEELRRASELRDGGAGEVQGDG